MFIFSFLESVATYLDDSIAWFKAGFRHRKAPLQAMFNQLKHLEFYNEESRCYLANGIIKLYGMQNTNVLLLETSGCFGNTDRSKISFDRHKGLYGALFSMTKSIADKFCKATMLIFSKLKVYFVHAADKIRFLYFLTFYLILLFLYVGEHICYGVYATSTKERFSNCGWKLCFILNQTLMISWNVYPLF
jgi:hypothetical protein